MLASQPVLFQEADISEPPERTLIEKYKLIIGEDQNIPHDFEVNHDRDYHSI
jgi:hypothetical protein